MVEASQMTFNTYPSIKELYISPHPDDVCYSCFSTVSKGKDEEEKSTVKNINGRIIVTVFSQSRCANGRLGEILNQDVNEISLIRQVEDKQFAESVGCRLHSLGLPDSSARDEFSRWTHLLESNSKEQTAATQDHPQYKEAYQALNSIIRWAVHCNAHIYMPLGIGCHVDHLMTRVAAMSILDDIKKIYGCALLPSRLSFYEDLPYAYYFIEDEIQQFVMNVLPKSARSICVPLDNECWLRKEAAVSGYATQLKPIILPDLRSRALALGAGDLNNSKQDGSYLCERMWMI